MRVLRWIVERSKGHAFAQETPIGWMPRYEDIDWRGLRFSKGEWQALMFFDRQKLKMQTAQHEELFLQLSERLPKALIFERELLVSRL
jgi:phosphoenolpyruvate carboxykinase (GTP)